jgi:hypothetical protein
MLQTSNIGERCQTSASPQNAGTWDAACICCHETCGEPVQGGIEVQLIDPSQAIPDILQACRLHAHLLDLLEDDLEKLADQTPTQGLGHGWLETGTACLSQDVKEIEAANLGDKNGIKMHHKLPMELRQDCLGLGWC